MSTAESFDDLGAHFELTTANDAEKKLLALLAAVMLLMSLTVTAPAAAEDCRVARLELLEARLKELVPAGTTTQTQADAMLARITERMGYYFVLGAGSLVPSGRRT